VGTAKKLCIFPLEFDGKTLLTAMADPTDLRTIDDISFMLGVRIKPVLALESEIMRAIERHYESDKTDIPQDKAPAAGPPPDRYDGPIDRTFCKTAGTHDSHAKPDFSRRQALEGLIDLLIDRGVISKEELIGKIDQKVSSHIRISAHHAGVLTGAATIRKVEEHVLAGRGITKDEALGLSSLSEQDQVDLFASANRVRARFRGDTVDLCSIINAKSGACTEDCSFCSQSCKSSAEISRFTLLKAEQVLSSAEAARQGGARRFCIVTSGRRVSEKDLGTIQEMLPGIRSRGLLPCATLGLLTGDELLLLKKAGLERYHNNLETSERFFPSICSTHTWQDKIKTLTAAKTAGLSVCSGGIFGLGETWEDRIDLAFALKELSPDSVPINFLTPIAGTRLETRQPLDPLEALKIISIYRFILPDKEIRVCGGRMQTLGDLNAMIFFAGADGLLTGNYLTTPGRYFEDDLKLIRSCGLKALA
jgi:biotin synthase